MKLNIPALALALAAIFSVFSLSVTIVHAATGYAESLINLLSSLYAGVVRFTHNGSLGLWENLGNNALSIFLCTLFCLIDGLILGACVGYLYNLFLPREKQ